jgi:hydrogenase expression/formation protein HypC
MCFGVPGRVTQIVDVAGLPTGKADFGGSSRDVCFAYVPNAQVGDYVVVSAGFAVRLVGETEATQALEIAALAAAEAEPRP